MLYTINTTPQTINTDEYIALGTNVIQTGCTATHVAGASQILLNKCGIYQINFSATGFSATGSENVTVEMEVNGVDYAGTLVSAFSGSPTENVNLSFTSLVKVEPNSCCDTTNVPTVIQFENENADTTYTNVSVVVTKLC